MKFIENLLKAKQTPLHIGIDLFKTSSFRGALFEYAFILVVKLFSEKQSKSFTFRFQAPSFKNVFEIFRNLARDEKGMYGTLSPFYLSKASVFFFIVNYATLAFKVYSSVYIILCNRKIYFYYYGR
jgi:hypothetical protein